MKIYPMQGAGPYYTNCYLIMGDAPGADGLASAVLVDASVTPAQVSAVLEKHAARLGAILLTHGHHDHVEQLGALRAAFAVPVYLAQPDATLHRIAGTVPYGVTAGCGDIKLAVIPTPGHTPGSVCLAAGGAVFCGDTLFAGSVGRTDLAGGDGAVLCRSLAFLVSALQNTGNPQLLPGHGPSANLAQELATNPYLKYAVKNPDGSF